MKETLKEAAENLFNDFQKENQIIPKNDIRPYKLGFIQGAKWQQERSYSEEDLREAFKQSRQALIFEKDMPPVYENFEEWFNQFKNK